MNLTERAVWTFSRSRFVAVTARKKAFSLPPLHLQNGHQFVQLVRALLHWPHPWVGRRTTQPRTLRFTYLLGAEERRR